MTVIRKDEETIEVVKQKYNETTESFEDVTNEFKLSFLTEQRERIETQKANEIAQRDKEIADVDTLLGYFETYPYVEPVPVVIEPIAAVESVPGLGTRIWNSVTSLFS